MHPPAPSLRRRTPHGRKRATTRISISAQQFEEPEMSSGAVAVASESSAWHSAVCFSVSALFSELTVVALRRYSRNRLIGYSHRLFRSKPPAWSKIYVEFFVSTKRSERTEAALA
jgi:hypothetical protein